MYTARTKILKYMRKRVYGKKTRLALTLILLNAIPVNAAKEACKNIVV